MKDVCNINQNSLPENTNKYLEIEYVDIGSVNFEKGIVSTESFLFKNAPSRARRLAKFGDTIISTVRTYLKAIDFVDERKSSLVYSTGFAVLNPVRIDPFFLVSFVRSDAFTNQVDIFSTGMSYPAINSTDLGRLHLPIPPLPEQTAIARFLDRKTAQIDNAIRIKERQIELLQERRQILIHRAVTRGLDPKAPLKDSGVEWIGEIPAHWEVKRAKFMFSKMEQGWSPQCDQYVAENDQWAVLKVGCVNGFAFNPYENKVLPKDLKPRLEYKVHENDILISRANTLELVGSAAIVPKIENLLLLCDKLYRVLINENEIVGSYYIYYLKTKIARNQIELGANGASPSMQNIGQSTIKDMFITVPPISEQKFILRHIEEGLSKIQNTISKKKQEIEKLKEYKGTLINSAVTGKIKVSAEYEVI